MAAALIAGMAGVQVAVVAKFENSRRPNVAGVARFAVAWDSFEHWL